MSFTDLDQLTETFRQEAQIRVAGVLTSLGNDFGLRVTVDGHNGNGHAASAPSRSRRRSPTAQPQPRAKAQAAGRGRPRGSGPTAKRIVDCLAANPGGLTIVALAEALGKEPGYFYRAVPKLVSEGLVRGPVHHGKEKLYFLTASETAAETAAPGAPLGLSSSPVLAASDGT